MDEEKQGQELDTETMARQAGWVPANEFRGDAAKWIDAETFNERAENELPIARGTIRTLGRKLETVERRFTEVSDTLEKFSEYHKTALERETAKAAAEYQRGLEEAQANMRQAVEEGDLEAFDKAKAKSDSLVKDAATLGDQPVKDSKPKGDPEITRQWIEDNDWFVGKSLQNFKMNKFARECGDFLAQTQPELKQKEQLEEIAKMVNEEFPDYFTNPARRKAAAVGRGDDTASPGNGRGKGYNDLPAIAKQACDQFCRDIPKFTKEKYLAQYKGPWKS